MTKKENAGASIEQETNINQQAPNHAVVLKGLGATVQQVYAASYKGEKAAVKIMSWEGELLGRMPILKVGAFVLEVRLVLNPRVFPALSQGLH